MSAAAARIGVGVLMSACLAAGAIPLRAEPDKRVVGATEVIVVEPGNATFRARVDTGARTSSIHAERIELASPDEPRGSRIAFDLVTDEGRAIRVETQVASVVTVRTAEHSERRYVVPLVVRWRDSRRTVLMTLNDRSRMHYRVLLGRNWLRGAFVVDVDRNSDD